jgi:hypothetical protein
VSSSSFTAAPPFPTSCVLPIVRTQGRERPRTARCSRGRARGVPACREVLARRSVVHVTLLAREDLLVSYPNRLLLSTTSSSVAPTVCGRSSSPVARPDFDCDGRSRPRRPVRTRRRWWRRAAVAPSTSADARCRARRSAIRVPPGARRSSFPHRHAARRSACGTRRVGLAARSIRPPAPARADRISAWGENAAPSRVSAHASLTSALEPCEHASALGAFESRGASGGSASRETERETQNSRNRQSLVPACRAGPAVRIASSTGSSWKDDVYAPKSRRSLRSISSH